MEIVKVIVLAVVQGLTEFLPISSSGHLVLLQNLFGMREPELLLDICLHVGTLISVVFVFRDEIGKILVTVIRLPSLVRSAGGWGPLVAENETARLTVLILVGSAPTAVLGMLFRQIADQIFGAVWIVGAMLVVTGSALWFTRRVKAEGRSVKAMRVKDALSIGVIQGLAILPGISRSGSTIATALFLGIDREVAGRYSFLLSIPAIMGALVLGLDPSLTHTTLPTATLGLGILTAAVVGYAALLILLKMVKKGRLYYFAPYCWLLGLVALIWHWL